ncbi:MAG TPA: ADOP family duplicated permease [Bryobacteraceae bacterium]|nr:ADOP family duplicated permease [Bryobacteraceae bacterium]
MLAAQSIASDIRSGFLLMRRDRGASALIVLVLAIGIGGNTAIFTLLKAAFLDPLPYPGAGRLVTIMENNGWTPSVSEFLQIRERSRTVEQLAFAEHRDMQVTAGGEPVRVFAARVSASFLPLLGAGVALGRTFSDDDNQPGRTPAVILTDTFWRSEMSGDPRVIGRNLRLDGQTAEIVGILAPNFQFDYPTLRIPEPVAVYVAYPIEREAPLRFSGSGQGIAVRVLGRLTPNAILGQAQAEMRNIGRALVREFPIAYRTRDGRPSRFTFDTLPLRDAIVGTQRSVLTLLLGGVGILLLIACANTAQLLLARSLRRSREIAIRAALGATRSRLLQQFLLEGLVLAVCGGAAGLLLAGLIARLVLVALPVRSPLLESAHLDWRVAAFASVASLLSGLVFASVPALKASHGTLGPSLTSRGGSGDGSRWRHMMIAVEAALSVFLLCGAALVAQNLWTLVTAPLGFNPGRVLAMQLKLPGHQQNLPDPEAKLVLQDYVHKVAAIPGIEAAATVTGPPLRPSRGGPLEIVGQTEKSGGLRTVMALSSQVSPDFFDVLRIPILAGRSFRESDCGSHIDVAIVNQEAARRFGLGLEIVGRQIADPAGPIEIVGVVANVRARGLDSAPFPEVYIPSRQLSWANAYLLVRSKLPAGQTVNQIKAALQSSNPDQAVFGVTTMQNMLSDAISEPRFNAWLVGTFALLAVVMATAGIYSVISFLVSQRSTEIAIRIALGATRANIARTVLGATSVWVCAGLACGLALALAARNLVRSLSNVAVQGSPWIYAAVALFFFAVTLAGALAPVRRANQTDPAAALHSE